MALFNRNGSNIWWISYTTPSGKRIRKSLKTTNKLLAKQKHDEIIADRWRQDNLGEQPKTTFKEVCDEYLSNKRNTPSIKSLESIAATLKHHFGDYYLGEIDDRAIFKFANDYYTTTYQVTKNGKYYQRTKSTVANMIRILAAILNFAKKELQLIDRCPEFNAMRNFREKNTRERYLTKSEAELLLINLHGIRRDIVRFALLTGMRISNIVNLKWRNVNLENKILYIAGNESKNGKNIKIHLSHLAIKLLSERKSNSKYELVFTNTGEKFVSTNNHTFKKALDKAKIAPYKYLSNRGTRGSLKRKYPMHPLDEYKYTDFRFHDLRHTWASWHVQAGTPLATLRDLGGWSSYTMVLRYAHLDGEHLSSHANNIQCEAFV